MGWAVGYNSDWHRDIGYGVPAICDHPECNAKIDRGIGYCCGAEPFGGNSGCGLHFCTQHQEGPKQTCERCVTNQAPFNPKPDTEEWKQHKKTDAS
jgi:hypothetical protein